MGYNTRFTFSVEEGSDELIGKFREFSEEAKWVFDEDGYCDEPCKWYEYQEDLVNFSKKHTDAIFLLEGEGEENGDAWRLYVKSGQIQECRAEMVYPEFDKGKLLALVREKTISKVLDK